MDADGILQTDLKPEISDSTFMAHVDYIRDVNGNGVIDPGDVLFGTPPSNATLVNSILKAGTYFVRIVSDVGSSNYRVNISADYAGATPDTAHITGPLDAGRSFTDFISTTDDAVDQYRFSVNSSRPFNFVFNESGGGTSELGLFDDRNNDGVPDASEAVLTTDAVGFSNALTSIRPGNYILQIKASTGAGVYQLFAQSPPDRVGNTLGSALNLGTVNGLVHQEEFVSEDDPTDFYKFTASAVGHVSAQLTPELGGNADLAIIRDTNNNGRVDPGEILAASALPLNQVDQLTGTIKAGTYFLSVNFNDVFSTTSKYFLSFQTDYAGSTPATAGCGCSRPPAEL